MYIVHTGSNNSLGPIKQLFFPKLFNKRNIDTNVFDFGNP